MDRRAFLAGTGAVLLVVPLVAEAQQPGRVYQIGVLPPGPISTRMQLWDAFRQGLRELGYVEGQNVALVIRSPEQGGKPLSDLAADLVRLKVDVIVAAATPGIGAAQRATRTIPIVMAASIDPVGTGFVASLARPGGNITGLDLLSADIAGKRLQLLRETIPGLSRVAILWNPSSSEAAPQWKLTQAAAQTLGMQLQSLEVRRPDEFGSAFQAATKKRAGALIMLDDPLLYTHGTTIVDLAAKSRLPVMYGFREHVRMGGFIVYGASLLDLYRRAATYVDKILKGAKPADLPVEQPTKFELVINLKTAKALGLTIPPSLLARADEVIQ
jgi:putative ABC transport system substrate-binding protein